MNIIPCTGWVKRGVSARAPEKVDNRMKFPVFQFNV